MRKAPAVQQLGSLGQYRLILFSAVGSIPLQVAAVIVFAGGASGLSRTVSGLFPSLALLGLFLSCSVLALGRANPLLRANLRGFVMVQAGLLLVVPHVPLALALVAWFAIGAISGLFMFCGMIAAANQDHKFMGYLLRVALAMVLSGTIALCVAWLPFGSPYLLACTVFAVIVLLVFWVAAPSRNPCGEPLPETKGLSIVLSKEGLSIAPLLLFFAGGLGIASNMSAFIPIVDGRFVSMEAFAAGKILGAAAVVGTLALSRNDSTLRLVVSVAALLLSAMVLGRSFLPPVLVVFCLEVALNVAGAAFMAEVARSGDPRLRPFIPVAGLLGLALGPVMGAVMVELYGPMLLRAACIIAIGTSLLWHIINAQVSREPESAQPPAGPGE
ncbi:MAG: hypothetical protein AAGJ94_15055 [Pseudomonadota bacterium]